MRRSWNSSTAPASRLSELLCVCVRRTCDLQRSDREGDRQGEQAADRPVRQEGGGGAAGRGCAVRAAFVRPGTSDPGTLFLSVRGKRMSPKGVNVLVNRYIGAVSELQKKSPHVLRHTFATHLREPRRRSPGRPGTARP